MLHFVFYLLGYLIYDHFFLANAFVRPWFFSWGSSLLDVTETVMRLMMRWKKCLRAKKKMSTPRPKLEYGKIRELWPASFFEGEDTTNSIFYAKTGTKDFWHQNFYCDSEALWDEHRAASFSIYLSFWSIYQSAHLSKLESSFQPGQTSVPSLMLCIAVSSVSLPHFRLYENLWDFIVFLCASPIFEAKWGMKARLKEPPKVIRMGRR